MRIQRTGRPAFYVSTPAGSNPLQFYLNDLLHDPERLASRLRSSEWSSVSVGSSSNHPRGIIGIPIARGVNRVGVLVGVDKNCEAWLAGWSRRRDAPVDLATDQYGWTRQEFSKSTGETMFIRFLDEGGRRTSRYYAVHCGFNGGFHAGMYEQIASGKSVLEHLLVDRSVDLSHR